jgi:hypothetical protein
MKYQSGALFNVSAQNPSEKKQIFCKVYNIS